MFPFQMIENYKGWDITLNWDNKDYLEMDTTKVILIKRKNGLVFT